MRAMINRDDNSVAFLETSVNPIHPSMLQEPSIFMVEFDGACLSDVPEEEYLNLFWSPEAEILYIHPEKFSLSTPSGKNMLREEIKAFSLIPAENRNGDQLYAIEVARITIGSDEVDDILADGVLEDAEIAAILGALDGG
tara:strand:- start:88 stop:507 length:420 start_codon:yes stop_codon:yes gene_type:complete